MRESQVESTTVARAKELGIRTMKLASPNDRGKPDRMFWRQQADGTPKVAFIEFKKTGENASKLQQKRLEDLRADGFPAECFDNMPMALKFLKTHLL